MFDLGRRRRYWFHMADEPLPMLDREALLAKAESGWPASVAVAIAATPADRLIAVSIAARAVPRRLATGRVICVVGRGKAGWPSTVRPSCSGSPERQCG
ncbi:MAG: hypothetical protein JWN21_190 [Sphingomonas bacterium]|uniref:hypothetical protein n=1 Tax=Sphingomonas bacterium TaxID=1895847 RepID=UPI002631DF84|nr:hypothetical protein [Sphingomonas bacterium]MDB5694647.1 hypothetical protein [Sphingomonas bacterium]